MKISLNLICRDELDGVIKAIESTKKVFDEVVVGVGDDGDKSIPDRLRAWGKKNQVKINSFVFPWTNDFDKARQQVMDKSTGEFIAWMDSDDVWVNPENVRKVCGDVFANQIFGAIVCNYNYDQDEDGKNKLDLKRERIVRKSDYFWKGKIHEILATHKRLRNIYSDLFEVKHEFSKEVRGERGQRCLKLAQDIYEEQAKTGSLEAMTVLNLARSLQSCYRYREALGKYDEFIAIASNDTDRCIGLMRKANIYRGLQEWDNAISSELEVVRIKPQNADGYLGQGMTYNMIERWEESISLLKIGMKLEPISGIPVDQSKYKDKPLKMLAVGNFMLGKMDDAILYCDSYLVIKPKDDDMQNIKKEAETYLKTVRKIECVIEIKDELTKGKEEDKLKNLILALPSSISDQPVFVQMRNKYFPVMTKNRLVIYCGPAPEQWGTDSSGKGIGGSEEAVINISKELSSLGWNVEIYNECSKPGDIEGVTWRNFWEFDPNVPCDVFIAWRIPEFIDRAPSDAKVYFWAHDVAEEGLWTRQEQDRCEKIIVLSKYHRDTFKWIKDESKFYISRNGILPEQFDNKAERSPFSCVYMSSPDRGLDVVLNRWPEIREKYPLAILHVCYGFNKGYLAMEQQIPHLTDYKMAILNEMKRLAPLGVVNHGRVSHMKIADLLLGSSYWLYPTTFPEISCISAMKTQAAGCWPICSNYGALKETVKYGDMLDIVIKPNLFGEYDEKAEKLWFDTVMSRMEKGVEEAKIKEMSDWAKKNYPWKSVAEEWHGLFKDKN